MPTGPPPALVRALVDGPSALAAIEWHDVVESTNTLAVEAARRGVPEIHAVLADHQRAGRGRAGRGWHAPPGTSLMVSFVLRPAVTGHARWTVPLLLGVVLAEVVRAHVSDGPDAPEVALKWPNDLLVGGRKAAGILVESDGDAVVAGIGCNVDWRGFDRPDELADAVSLAEAVGRPVDRWKLFAGLVGVLDRRYATWQRDPLPVLDAYRARCSTIGQRVRVALPGRGPAEGTAVAVGDDGTLEVDTSDGPLVVAAGDVIHVRPA